MTVRERPILFSGEMVRQIIAGRKSQTRRVMNPQPELRRHWSAPGRHGLRFFAGQKHEITIACDYMDRLDSGVVSRCPYGVPGDALWARETWALWDGGEHARHDSLGVTFRADCLNARGEEDSDSKRARLDFGVKWRPSIFLPRKLSRLTLRVTDVRIECVQSISEEDAKAEGTECRSDLAWDDAVGSGDPYATAVAHGHRDAFRALWDSINGKRPGCSWEANPWVWAVTFKVMR